MRGRAEPLSFLLHNADSTERSFFMVNPEDLRRLEAAERNAGSLGAPSIHNRSTSRRRGADANINLPDEDMITGEDGVSGCASIVLAARRSAARR